MKRKAVVFNTVFTGALTLTSFSALSSEAMQAKCAEDNQSATCQAYIAGIVEGYIASKQKYVAKQPEFSSDYINRVYASRVNTQRLSMTQAQPACLPNNVDTSEVVAKLKEALPSQDLTAELGDYLRKQYPCD